MLVLFSPLWALIAIIIRLTSSGPALYCQRRVVGKGGREFTVYKFRTMFDNNDDTLHKHAIARFLDGQPLDVVEKNGVQKPVYKLTHDPRVTRFGSHPAQDRAGRSAAVHQRVARRHVGGRAATAPLL